MKYAAMTALTLATASYQPALAQHIRTGNDLLKECEAVPDPGYCLGYITGAVDMALQNETNNKSINQICLMKIPVGATAQQLEAIVMKYLHEHPEHLHYGGGYLVIEALGRAFPCN